MFSAYVFYECTDADYHGVHDNPDSKVHRANMGPIWSRQDPGGPHVGPMNFVIWEYQHSLYACLFHMVAIMHECSIYSIRR